MHLNLKAIASIGLVLTTILATSSCSETESNGSMNPTSSDQADMKLGAQDVMFLQMMIPHHEQAILMSDIAQEQADSDAIKKLAKAISVTQQVEIEQMREWLNESGSPQHSDGHPMGTDGMLSEEEILELRGANGKAFDSLFVEGMTKHHKGAIEMAQVEVDSGENEKVQAFAVAIIALQGAELVTLKAIKKLIDLKSKF